MLLYKLFSTGMMTIRKGLLAAAAYHMPIVFRMSWQAILEAKVSQDVEAGHVADALKSAFQGTFDDEMVKILVRLCAARCRLILPVRPGSRDLNGGRC